MDCSGTARLFGVAIMVICVVGFFGAGIGKSQGAVQCSNATFCGGWYAVCKRTLPVGGSISVCDQRRSACLSSGCFHFNNPRPRCKSNPADLKLTTACQRASR